MQAALGQVRRELAGMQAQVERVAEQQEFVERALTRDTPGGE